MDDLTALKDLKKKEGMITQREKEALDRVIKLLEIANKLYGGMFPQ